MGRDTSIVYKAIDELTGPLTTMRGSNKAFDKDLEELSRTMEAYRKREDSIAEGMSKTQKAVDAAAKELKEAKKAYQDLNSEANSTKLEKAHDEYNKLTNELKAWQGAAKDTQRAMSDLTEQKRRMYNQEAGDGMLGKLGQAGLTQMLGQSFSEAGNALFGSAFGSEAGTMFSSALSGITSGAAMGSLAGPLGTAIGAAVGGLSGLISGGTQVFQKQDDSFKSSVQESYSTSKQQQDKDIGEGSGTAMLREDDLRVFTTLLDDDADAANRFQSSLIELGRTPPFSYSTVSALSKDMLGLGLSTDEASGRINALAEAAAALNLSESNVTGIVSYLESAQLAGKLDTRVVKSLSKLGINAYEALAEEFGISQDEVMDQLGKLDVDRAVQSIYDYMGGHFLGASAGLTDTFQGASGILESYQEDMQNAYGKGFNQKRQEGLNADIDAYGGDLGIAVKEANAAIGASEAYLENLNGDFQRQAMSALLLGEDAGLFDADSAAKLGQMHEDYERLIDAYNQGDQEAGIEIAALKQEAQNMADEAYGVSDAVQKAHDVELDLISAIQDNTIALGAWRLDYETSDALGKGTGMGIMDTVKDALSSIRANGGVTTMRVGDPDMDGANHAYGLDRVPYDGYPAMLHEGERVLTAQQARQADAGRGAPAVQVTVTGNSFYGSDQAMEERVARRVGAAVQRAILLATP